MFQTQRKTLRAVAFTLFACVAGVSTSLADTREETLRYVTGGTITSLDPMTLGATGQTIALSAALYDRLVAFDSKLNDDGTGVFIFEKIHGELAQSYDVSADGLTLTFNLRTDATFHDGTPVTAADVKWSLDRAVTADTIAKGQLKTGSLISPEQFNVIDDHTVTITLDKANRLTLPNLASLFAPIYNSQLVAANAGSDDPWGVEWLQTNEAGSGAYSLDEYEPGQFVKLARNDEWKNGILPDFKNVIIQTVPETSTRANLIERGDADVTDGLKVEDVIALNGKDNVKVVSASKPTAFTAVVFNTRLAPFDNVDVRRAISLALPYDDMFEAAAAGLGQKLYGATWEKEPETSAYPQPLPLHTDLAMAKELLAKAGYPDGFDTTLSYAVRRSSFADPASALIQESLAKIGINVTIAKLPNAQMAEAQTNKTIAFSLETSFAMFPSAEYFARIFLSGESRWNFSSWQNAEVDALLPQARYEADQTKYDTIAKRVIGLAAEEVPMAMLWQPTQNVVMGADIDGFKTWYNYYVDPRDLKRN